MKKQVDIGNADLWAIKKKLRMCSHDNGKHLKFLLNCLENCLMRSEEKPGTSQEGRSVAQARGMEVAIEMEISGWDGSTFWSWSQ